MFCICSHFLVQAGPRHRPTPPRRASRRRRYHLLVQRHLARGEGRNGRAKRGRDTETGHWCSAAKCARARAHFWRAMPGHAAKKDTAAVASSTPSHLFDHLSFAALQHTALVPATSSFPTRVTRRRPLSPPRASSSTTSRPLESPSSAPFVLTSDLVSGHTSTLLSGRSFWRPLRSIEKEARRRSPHVRSALLDASFGEDHKGPPCTVVIGWPGMAKVLMSPLGSLSFQTTLWACIGHT